MTGRDEIVSFSIGVVIGLIILGVAYLLIERIDIRPHRFLWIDNPANVETWNGACLDLETRQIVPSVHCEE